MSPVRGRRRDTERGSASVLVVGALAFALLAVMVVGDISLYLRGRAEAMAAADAAALAAAPVTFHAFGGGGGDPVVEARRFAAANGASLSACTCPPDATWRPRSVQVKVAVPVSLMLFGAHQVAASSVAEFDPVRLASTLVDATR